MVNTFCHSRANGNPVPYKILDSCSPITTFEDKFRRNDDIDIKRRLYAQN